MRMFSSVRLYICGETKFGYLYHEMLTSTAIEAGSTLSIWAETVRLHRGLQMVLIETSPVLEMRNISPYFWSM